MRIKILREIQHTPNVLLRKGETVDVLPMFGRRYVRRGWAIDVNGVMKDEPQTEEKTVPEGKGENKTKRTTKKESKDKNKGGDK